MLPSTQAAANSVAGKIERAQLILHDKRGAAAPGGPGSGGGPGGLGDAASQQVTTNATNAAMANPAAGVAGSGAVVDRTLHVQFNPSELSMYSAVQANKVSNTASTGQASHLNANEAAKIDLTFTLYFDEMNIFDSFMFDKFTGGVSAQSAVNIASGIAAAGENGKVWSVKPKVEGLVAALRNPLTRTVTFAWGTFKFKGTVNSVNATYTMFSTQGHPVRAKVLIRMRHSTVQTDLAIWHTKLQEAFGLDVNTKSRVGQKAGNLINIGI